MKTKRRLSNGYKQEVVRKDASNNPYHKYHERAGFIDPDGRLFKNTL